MFKDDIKKANNKLVLSRKFKEGLKDTLIQKTFDMESHRQNASFKIELAPKTKFKYMRIALYSVFACSFATIVLSLGSFFANDTPSWGVVQTNSPSPTPIASTPGTEQTIPTVSPTYYYNVIQEWEPEVYQEKYQQDINYVSAPIFTNHLYEYTPVKGDETIKDIAYELGLLFMEDMMKEYEGKTFTITEYKDLKANVLSGTELEDWYTAYKTIRNIKLLENQWLVKYSCKYKYSGEYALIGEMPSDVEWMEGLDTDGSGETYYFIIQYDNKLNQYQMRSMTKSILFCNDEMVR